MRTLSVVVPCYNEEAGVDQLKARLVPVLDRLSPDYDVELLLVDDGSTDRTFERLEAAFGPRPGARVIRHAFNQNVGAAIRTGVRESRGEWIANLDSDCTYDPALLEPMLACMEGGADLVTASPYHPNGEVVGVPAYRLVLSKGASTLYGLLLSTHVRTFTAMVRVYSREAYRHIGSDEDDFMSLAETILRALKQGMRVDEVPASLAVRKFGQSKLRILQVILGHLKLMGRLVLSPRSFTS